MKDGHFVGERRTFYVRKTDKKGVENGHFMGLIKKDGHLFGDVRLSSYFWSQNRETWIILNYLTKIKDFLS